MTTTQKSIEVTVMSADNSKKSDTPLIDLLKGKFSSQEVDGYTQKVRSKWKKNI